MKKKYEDLWFPSTKMAVFWLCGVPLIYIGLYLMVVYETWVPVLCGFLAFLAWVLIGVWLEKGWRSSWYRAMDENSIAKGHGPIPFIKGKY